MNLQAEMVLPEGVEACDLPPTPPGIELDEQASTARIVIASARAVGRIRDGDGPDQGHFPKGTTYRMVRDNPVVAIVSNQLAITMGFPDELNAIPTIENMRYRGSVFVRYAETGRIFKTVDSGSRAAADHEYNRVYLGHIHASGETSQTVGRYPKGTAYSPFDPDRSGWTVAVQGRADQIAHETLVDPLSDGGRQELWQGRILHGALVGAPPDRAPKTHQERDQYIEDRYASGELRLSPAAKYMGLWACFHVPVPSALIPFRDHLSPALVGMLPEETREAYGLAYGPKEEEEFHEAVAILSKANSLPEPIKKHLDSWLFWLAAKTEQHRGIPYIPDPYAEQV